VVSQDQRRLEQAEGHYRNALEIFLTFADRYGAGIVLYSFPRLRKEATWGPCQRQQPRR